MYSHLPSKESVWWYIQDHIIKLQRLLSDISVGDNSKLPNLREVITHTKAMERWSRCEDQLNDSLGMALGSRLYRLGTHMGTENYGVPTNDFFLPLEHGLDANFGASSADVSVPKMSVPPPQNLTTRNVIRLKNFLPKLMTGLYENYGTRNTRTR